MQKKRSPSKNKSSKKKVLPKKKGCSMCTVSSSLTMLMQNALYRKYSSNHFSQPKIIDKYIKTTKSQNTQIDQEYIQKYYKTVHRKHQFRKIKQIYKVHQQSPRLLIPGIHEIITKCYHRKRLLKYFKIAKILGIRVQTVKFSTFLLSVSKSHQLNPEQKEHYDKLIGKISGYEFSQNIEKQLIETLENKQNKMNPSNLRIQNEKYIIRKDPNKLQQVCI